MMKLYLLSIEDQQALIQQYISGASTNSLAEKFNCDRRTIVSYLKSKNVYLESRYTNDNKLD